MRVSPQLFRKTQLRYYYQWQERIKYQLRVVMFQPHFFGFEASSRFFRQGKFCFGRELGQVFMLLANDKFGYPAHSSVRIYTFEPRADKQSAFKIGQRFFKKTSNRHFWMSQATFWTKKIEEKKFHIFFTFHRGDPYDFSRRFFVRFFQKNRKGPPYEK